MTRREGLLFAALMILLAVAVGWIYGRMAAARTAAAEMQRNTAQCRRYAEDIESSRQRPAIATEDLRIAEDITRIVEETALAHGIAADAILRIDPDQPARRVGDTVYREKPTEIIFKGVTLEQLTGTVHAIVSGQERLEARSIRLRAPRRQDTGRRWDVELVLTYLVYDPPKTIER